MSLSRPDSSDGLRRYLDHINPPEHPVLAEIRRATAQHRKSGMSIATEQAQILIWLARLIRAERYLEIGVFTGYSSTAVALALPEHGRVTACDINLTYTDMARHFWQKAGVAHKIELHLQPAVFTLDALIAQGLSGQYDMALIDADKWPTSAYYERCLKLLRPGGIIAIDNILLHGRVAQTPQPDESDSIRAMRAFNEALAQDTRVHVLTLPLGDGLTLMVKNHEQPQ